MTSIFRLFSETRPTSANLKVLNFERLVEERTRQFVGRDFIFKSIDALLSEASFPSGYILVRGEPGIGKTALMGQLVKTRSYVHHFNVAPQNIRSVRAFLENVCSQLIIRYELDHRVLPAEASQDSAFLSRLLAEAKAKAHDGKVVVAVDALDEAEDVGLPPDANRLLLPPALPDGVYFILTSREQMDYRLDTDRRKDIYLRDDDPLNLGDIREYVRDFLGAHREMEERLAAWETTTEAFVELITIKSQGNFMYLVHVLEDIRSGISSRQTLNNIHDLPVGLTQYYERHWRFMRARDEHRFETVYDPVLRLLATVREPVSVGQLLEWTSLERRSVQDVIREWRMFLNEVVVGCEKRYRVYHVSFQEFLASEGLGLTPSHQRLAERALRKIPGFLPDC
jgi:hypothetical protein